MQDYRNLEVWRRGHALTLKVYGVVRLFPRDEMYGLSSQMRNSSSSIPTNLAEGCGRGSSAELRRFALIASGSASELDYQLLLAKDLEYLEMTQYDTLHDELRSLRRMLHTFVQTLNKQLDKPNLKPPTLD